MVYNLNNLLSRMYNCNLGLIVDIIILENVSIEE